MDLLLSGANVFLNDSFSVSDILVADGRIVNTSPDMISGCERFDFDNCFVFPGFVDVHVHLREPGFIYKETIMSGSRAAAHGGFTHIFAMPNLDPVPDSVETLTPILERIKDTATVNVFQYGALTVGEKGEKIADISGMSAYTKCFSDDGRGVQSESMMRSIMEAVKKENGIIAAHCEDNSLLGGAHIHDGAYAKAHGIKGISSESEWRQIKRDLRLASETGVKYHVCHISTKESVSLIRNAKKRGVDVTCETAPHYLLLDESFLKDDGRFKMNPPLRSSADREALIEGILDGTIDCIATDHAPHSKEEKSKGLIGSTMGVVGLETSFPVMYTGFVKSGIISLSKLILLMHTNPARRFGIDSDFETGKPANFTVFDLNTNYNIDPSDFQSGGKSTPFEGMSVYGKCLMTVVNGKTVWRDENVHGY